MTAAPWRDDFLDFLLARGIKPTPYQRIITLAFNPRVVQTTQISKFGPRVGATALLHFLAIEAVEEANVDVVFFNQGGLDQTKPDPVRQELRKWTSDLSTMKRVRRINTALVNSTQAAAEVSGRGLALIDDANLLDPATFTAIQSAAAGVVPLIIVP